MKVTYLGHGCFKIVTKGIEMLVDPFITPNPLASHIDEESLNPDYLLLTHGHQDHVVDVDMIVQQSGAMIISNFEIASYYGEKGYDNHGMNHGGCYEFEFGTLKYVSAIHSSVLPDGTYGGNPGGFVLWNEEGCIYLAGDTALTMDMKLIPLSCPKLDLAIFPIGDNFTMGYKDAAIASDFIQCNQIIGCHYDTFPPIKIDKTKAVEHFDKKGKKLMLPDIGESISI